MFTKNTGPRDSPSSAGRERGGDRDRGRGEFHVTC